MTRRFQFAVSFFMAVAAAAPTAVAGQSLHLAELFADQGRSEDALAEVLAWFEIRGADATDREVQHGLFLRGRLAADPADGMQDMLRILDDYPRGAFAPRALEWLALSADRSGDAERASALRMRVVRDFPEADEAPAAHAWLAEHGIATPETPKRAAVAADTVPVAVAEPTPVVPTAAPADSVRADDPPADAGPPPEVGEVIVMDTVAVDTVAVESVPSDSVPSDLAKPDISKPDTVPSDAPAPDSVAVVDEASEPSVASPPATDTTPAAPAPQEERPAPVPHGPPVPGAAEGGAWAVQIGAFRNPVGAGGLVDDLVEAGLDARLVQVPMNDLLRVRVGRFPTQAAAEAGLERVRAAGWDGALVADARRETVVRR